MIMLKDKKTKITFHSGVLTIGVTIIEIDMKIVIFSLTLVVSIIHLQKYSLLIYKDY